jgi:hypothetical protein
VSRVCNYQTGSALEGEPSEALIEASAAESSGTGAVCAYRDADGVWQYVPEDEEDFYRRVRGEDVRVVWVQS